eukprot:4372596-Amphidinium_carterae.2
MDSHSSGCSCACEALPQPTSVSLPIPLGASSAKCSTVSHDPFKGCSLEPFNMPPQCSCPSTLGGIPGTTAPAEQGHSHGLLRLGRLPTPFRDGLNTSSHHIS